jgi:hypothetical protein
MKDEDKSRGQPIADLARVRRQATELEASESARLPLIEGN